jgi:hypothetical protein
MSANQDDFSFFISRGKTPLVDNCPPASHQRPVVVPPVACLEAGERGRGPTQGRQGANRKASAVSSTHIPAKGEGFVLFNLH